MNKGLHGQVRSATRSLAEFVATTAFEQIPEDVRRRAGWIVADTLAVSLYGSKEPEVERLYARIAEEDDPGKAVVMRRGLPRLNARSAAFLNAVAACFLELDEGMRPTGHPALHVLPAALAAAQQRSLTGREFLTGFILGYEVQARLQRACQLRSVVHPHGNFGHVGAIAALGKLSGWTEEYLYQGMISASGLVMATSWQPCLVGATVRNAFPGLSVQTAFTVSDLVECGFTGYDGALAETFGEILGSGFDVEELTRDLGSRYLMVENYFKFHAACALTHPVLDAVGDALGVTYTPGAYPPWKATNLPTPEDISRVRVWILERSQRLNVAHRPNSLSAKFSIPFVVAAFLVRGSADPDSFGSEALRDPGIAALSKRVEVVSELAWSAEWPYQHPARVEVELTDGRLLTGVCANPYGSAGYGPSEEDLRAKFDFLTDGMVSTRTRDLLWTSATSIWNVMDMSAFPTD